MRRSGGLAMRAIFADNERNRVEAVRAAIQYLNVGISEDEQIVSKTILSMASASVARP